MILSRHFIFGKKVVNEDTTFAKLGGRDGQTMYRHVIFSRFWSGAETMLRGAMPCSFYYLISNPGNMSASVKFALRFYCGILLLLRLSFNVRNVLDAASFPPSQARGPTHSSLCRYT